MIMVGCFHPIYSQLDSLKTKNTITLDLSDLEVDDTESSNSSMVILGNGLDNVFFNYAGFLLRNGRYTLRGQKQSLNNVLLNNINQLNFWDNSPNWNTWSGLDELNRKQERYLPNQITDSHIGGALGLINLTTQPSLFRKGSRLSANYSNINYQYKLYYHYNSGWTKNNLNYQVITNIRNGKNPQKEGTFFDGNSFLGSIEKKINPQNTLFTSLLLTQANRGLNGIYTDEVYQLKGNLYNDYWGFQNGKIRNSKVQTFFKPTWFLVHEYLTPTIQFKNTLSYQFSTNTNSELDYNLGTNPYPTYYTKLPSYWLSKSPVDNESLYWSQQQIIQNGQLDWNAIYTANRMMNLDGNPNAYVLYNNITNENTINYVNQFKFTINPIWYVSGNLSYKFNNSNQFARINDLLGGNGYLDQQAFTFTDNNVFNPDLIVHKNDIFKYHYKLQNQWIQSFLQLSYSKKNHKSNLGSNFSYHSIQREGIFKNEIYPEGYGKSKAVHLPLFQTAFNHIYQITPKSRIHYHGGWYQNFTGNKNIFINPEYSNLTLATKPPTNFNNAVSYFFKNQYSRIDLSLYHQNNWNGIERRSYYAEDLYINNNMIDEFVYEVLTNVKQQQYGIELGSQIDISHRFQIISLATINQFKYTNNPTVTLYTDPTEEAINNGFINGVYPYGISYLKDKNIGNLPRQAYAISLQYTDPDFWRIRVGFNYYNFNNLDIAPIKYTQAFGDESNNPVLINTLTAQEKIKSIGLIDLSGSKSFKLNKQYLSIVWSVQNLFNHQFRTGGYDNARTAHYTAAQADYERTLPLFGAKYFTGNGRTYFIGTNFYF